jgi:hypothetical protein
MFVVVFWCCVVLCCDLRRRGAGAITGTELSRMATLE